MHIDRFFIQKDNTSILLVDIQERLAAVMKAREKVVNNCLHLIELGEMLDLPIILTEQYPKGIGQTVAEIRSALPSYQPIEKLTFSCCEEPDFMNEIKRPDRENIVLAGMETHICVLQTAISLLKEGFNVHVVGDAVCSRAKENWKAGLEFMRDAGAVVTCTETVLFQLLGMAGTEEFRTISKRIK